MSFPADADYTNELFEMCSRADKPPYWGEKERWLRKNVHNIRRTTEACGEERFKVTKVEDIRFYYKPNEDNTI